MVVATHATKVIPDSNVHGANIGPTWVLSAPDGPHVGPMNLAINVCRRSNRVNWLYGSLASSAQVTMLKLRQFGDNFKHLLLHHLLLFHYCGIIMIDKTLIHCTSISVFVASLTTWRLTPALGFATMTPILIPISKTTSMGAMGPEPFYVYLTPATGDGTFGPFGIYHHSEYELSHWKKALLYNAFPHLQSTYPEYVWEVDKFSMKYWMGKWMAWNPLYTYFRFFLLTSPRTTNLTESILETF